MGEGGLPGVAAACRPGSARRRDAGAVRRDRVLVAQLVAALLRQRRVRTRGRAHAPARRCRRRRRRKASRVGGRDAHCLWRVARNTWRHQRLRLVVVREGEGGTGRRGLLWVVRSRRCSVALRVGVHGRPTLVVHERALWARCVREGDRRWLVARWLLPDRRARIRGAHPWRLGVFGWSKGMRERDLGMRGRVRVPVRCSVRCRLRRRIRDGGDRVVPRVEPREGARGGTGLKGKEKRVRALGRDGRRARGGRPARVARHAAHGGRGRTVLGDMRRDVGGLGSAFGRHGRGAGHGLVLRGGRKERSSANAPRYWSGHSERTVLMMLV